MNDYTNSQDFRNLKKVWTAFKSPNPNIDLFVAEKEINPYLRQKRIIDFVESIGGRESKIDACDIKRYIPKLIDLFQNTLACTHFMRDFQYMCGGTNFKIDLLALSKNSCYIVEIENNCNYSSTTRLENNIQKVNKYMSEFDNLAKKGMIFSVAYTDDFKLHTLASGFYFATANEDGYELNSPLE